MVDKSKAFEISEGLILNDTNGNELAFITSGLTPPVGLNLPQDTLYFQTSANGLLYWIKFGTGVNDWRLLSAQDIPFDPSLVDLTSTETQSAIEELANRHYGKDFAEQIKEASETVSGGAFVTYDTLTFNVSDTSGVNKYRLAFNYLWGHNSASNDIRVEHRLDGVNIFEMRKEPKDPGTDQRIDGSFVSYVENLSQGTHSISLAYRPATANRTSRMYRSNLEVWRVE
jgi:hypothetical protein